MANDLSLPGYDIRKGFLLGAAAPPVAVNCLAIILIVRGRAIIIPSFSLTLQPRPTLTIVHARLLYYTPPGYVSASLDTRHYHVLQTWAVA